MGSTTLHANMSQTALELHLNIAGVSRVVLCWTRLAKRTSWEAGHQREIDRPEVMCGISRHKLPAGSAVCFKSLQWHISSRQDVPFTS